LAEAARIDPDHAIVAGQRGYPAVEQLAALGLTVVKDDGLRLQSGVAEVVVRVVHLQIARKAR
jgi:hypothetical protein